MPPTTYFCLFLELGPACFSFPPQEYLQIAIKNLSLAQKERKTNRRVVWKRNLLTKPGARPPSTEHKRRNTRRKPLSNEVPKVQIRTAYWSGPTSPRDRWTNFSEDPKNREN